MKITSIIPIINLSKDRKRNLEFIYQRLIEAKINIIFVVQAKKIDKYFNKFKKAKILNFYKKNNKFNKAFLFNSCLKKINFKEDFILFLDADIYLPFKDLKSKLDKQDEIVQPFFDCYYFDEKQTNSFIKKREASILPEFKKVFSLGACSLILNKKIIKKIKFNEKFNSWGQEDVDLGAKSKHLKVRTITQPAIHLYHKNNIDVKITHIFNCEKNYDKKAIKSYIKFSNKNILLLNYSEKNYLKKVKYKKAKKFKYGYSLEEMLNTTAENCKNNEWILFTDANFRISEHVYYEISKCQKDYMEFYGCVVDDGDMFRETGKINGFAIRKSLLSSFYAPKVFTKDANFQEYLENYFKDIKKIKIENQLIKTHKKQDVKIEKFYKAINTPILFFAPTAPDPHSSGGDRILKILKILKSLNYQVYFFCNTAKQKSHLETLKKMQIPFYLPKNGSLIQDLKNIKSKVNYAIFSWYDMGLQYIDIVKEIFPDIKIMVDSVDIHWKRELRGLDVKEMELSKEEVLIRKEEEKNVYSKSNVVFVVTDDDKKEVLKEVGHDHNVKILSNIHTPRDSKSGNDIIFIGNFNHTPNISAAISSIKIYKKFANTEAYKNLKIKPKIYIVGQNVPTQIFEMCDNKNCLALNNVENLDQIYDKIKVSISPLTWGSGIKGKICDAACRDKVILTSDIGNEGINLVDGISGFIANKEEDFVGKLIDIYENKNIHTIIKKGKQIVQNIVSKESAISVIKHTLWAKPVTIVIVTYNKSFDLERCLNSILKNTNYPNYKIVVYDNASTDNTSVVVGKFKQDYPNIIDYIKSETNEYFVIPNNIIMKDEKYLETDLVLVNNDIEIITKDWLTHLYSTAYSEYNICAVGAKILYPDGILAEAGSELYNDGLGMNIGSGEDKNDPEYNTPRYVGYCSGCLLYMRRDAIEKVGIFDHNFAPMYYEESDWQYRAHMYGLKTIYQPKVEVIHHESKIKLMKKHQEVNRTKFVKKFYNKNIEQYNK